ncbi:MAG: hypothetical protein AAGD43_28565, partial [Pseudomonadota bacterium]
KAIDLATEFLQQHTIQYLAQAADETLTSSDNEIVARTSNVALPNSARSMIAKLLNWKKHSNGEMSCCGLQQTSAATTTMTMLFTRFVEYRVRLSATFCC